MDENIKSVHLYSISKLYTALLCCIARQEGRLDFEKSITEYLKDFSLFYGSNDVSEDVTIKRLLTNSSGLFNNARLGNNFYSCEDLEKHVNSISGCKLLFLPGTNYKYSNTGFNILGFILECIYGEKYETLVEKKIFKPLGMEHAEFSSTNKCLNPSTGLIATFDDALKGVKALISKNSPIDLLSEFDFANSLYRIKDKQISGFGYGCKVFKCMASSFCIVTGSYLNEYVVQVWSKEYRLGMLLYAQNEITKLIELFDKHDLFWETLLALQDARKIKSVNPVACNTKPEINISNHEIKNYISNEGSFIFLFFFNEDCICISNDKKKWIKLMRHGNQFVGSSYTVEFEVELARFYIDSDTEFGTFYRNDMEFTLKEGDKDWYQNEYILDESLEENEMNRQNIRAFNRVNKIYFTYQKNRMYLNGYSSLGRIEKDTLVTPYGEKIIIYKDSIMIGNVKYIIKNKKGKN
nr:serine hydrolase domain-containing protein [Zhenhengia yiwuensis]